MSINLIEADIIDIQKKYYHLMNYESDNPNKPIDPFTYVDSNGDHLLHIAAQLGDIKTIELLLKAGLDVNQAGDMGCTPLHYAKMKKRDDVADFLLAHGASTSLENAFGKLPK